MVEQSRQQLLPFDDFKITPERFVAWAEDRVRHRPTYRPAIWDYGQDRQETRPNTVERELGGILRRHTVRDYADFEQSELLEAIRDLAWSGTKGIADMSRAELLAEIMEEIVEPLLEEEPGTTWDDLLADSELFSDDD